MRLFILLLAVMASVGLLGTLGTDDGLVGENRGAEVQSVSRPNFVFVMTDDLNHQSMEELPGIETLMGSNGVTFENAYVTYAVCCPSRASFFRASILTIMASPPAMLGLVNRGSGSSGGGGRR